jgi:hypothetical protein
MSYRAVTSKGAFMSRGQRGNKEAKKAKKPRPLVEDVLPVTGLPMMSITAPTPRRKRK